MGWVVENWRRSSACWRVETAAIGLHCFCCLFLEVLMLMLGMDFLEVKFGWRWNATNAARVRLVVPASLVCGCAVHTLTRPR
jgi:hypothetical protein